MLAFLAVFVNVQLMSSPLAGVTVKLAPPPDGSVVELPAAALVQAMLDV